MRGAVRTMLHALLLGLLVASVGYGAFAVIEFVVSIGAFALGYADPPEVSVGRVVSGVLMATLWACLIGAGSSALGRQWWRGRRLRSWLAEVGTDQSPALMDAVARSGIRCPVVQVGDSARYAFTYGLWRPRIAISSGLVSALGPDELLAVLYHEGYHVEHRDPLKVLAFRTWAAAFFLMPMIGAVLRRLLARQELAADRLAMRHCDVGSVAGALLKAVDGPRPAPGAAVAAMAGAAVLEARVVQLETGCAPAFFGSFSRRMVIRSGAGLVVVVTYVALFHQACFAAVLCCCG